MSFRPLLSLCIVTNLLINLILFGIILFRGCENDPTPLATLTAAAVVNPGRFDLGNNVLLNR
jgi:hypothetical protein